LSKSVEGNRLVFKSEQQLLTDCQKSVRFLVSLSDEISWDFFALTQFGAI